MKDIVVIDTKLVFYFQYHRHKHPFNALQDVAKKLEANSINPTKIIWACDVGKSKRTQFYPEYKAHRKDDIEKSSKKEQKRREDFEELYYSSFDFLKNFGTVIALDGIEADDIAATIAERYSDNSSIRVVLVSSDEDWARFLFTDNIVMLHYGKGELITKDKVVDYFEVPQELKLHIDALTGVSKENVDGIRKAGKKRVLKAYKDGGETIDGLITLLDEWCESKKYGFSLPEWANEVRDVYNRNIDILHPITFDSENPKHSMTVEEKSKFREQWITNNPTVSEHDILFDSLEEYKFAVNITPTMKKIYKIS